MSKDKYPYEVRGNGYIHRPSHTYFQNEKFVKFIYDEEYENDTETTVPNSTKPNKLRSVVRNIARWLREIKSKISER